MILFLLLACGDPPVSTVETVAGDEPETEAGPTAHVYVGDPPATASPLGPEQLEPAIQQAFDSVLAIDSELVAEGHAQMLKLADESCPAFTDHNNQKLWYEFCETAEGAVFRGYSLSATLYGLVMDDIFHERWMWYTARMWVQDLKGYVFQLWGDCLIEETISEEGAQEKYVVLDGDFRWDDPSVAGSWLQDDLSIWLYTLESEHPTHKEHWFDGSVSRLHGDLVAIQFHDVLFSTAEGGCEAEPAGMVSVWDEHGNRYDVSYDKTCDGCGYAVLDDGTEIGSVCTDFSGAMAWDGLPW